MLRGKATGHVPRPTDVNELRRAVRLLFDPDAGVQIQGLPSGRWRICKGDDWPAILAAATELGDEKGAYFSLNPCPPDLTKAIHAGDMLRRRWLLLDIDPRRPPDTNSTEKEKATAWAVTERVQAFLGGWGWPGPIVVDSGNGYHLLYRIDLPNDDAARVLLPRLIRALAARFDTKKVILDPKVHNANRISKLPGTWASKGPHSAQRPHRLCRIKTAPATVQVVAREQLQAVAAGTPAASGESDGQERPRSRLAGKAVGQSREAAYAQAALRDEFYAVARESPTGHNRNNRLNEAALKMGTLIGAGYIDRARVEGDLLQAALACGLPEDEARKTIRSGIEAGVQKPRTVPERNGPAAAATAGRTPLCTATLEGLHMKPLFWLVPNMFPVGKLSLLAGDGGLGKSVISLDLAARVSRGQCAFGLEYVPPPAGRVLLASCEDDYEDTIIPRLLAAGADLGRIDRLDGVAGKDGKPQPWSFAHAAALAEHLALYPYALIIIDPASAFAGRAGIDGYKDAEVRALLAPMSELAARFGVTILLIAHIGKGETIKAAQRILGSVAWKNVVRSVWMAAEREEDGGKRMLLPAKANLAPEQKGVLYQLLSLDEQEQEQAVEGYAGELSEEDRALIKKQLFHVRWMGTTDATADRVFAGQGKGGERQTNVERCVQWLKEFLADFAYPDAEVRAAAEAEGFSDRALRSAKEALRKDTPSLEYSKRGAFQGGWWNGLGSPEHWTRRPEPSGETDEVNASP
jgi:hypothetical protein